ncbi:hypothetical protein ACFYZ5_47240 [Streptomyces chartreusis]|uniref:hypothetical protein n=1 Tax=Streptomyces chartreusis TaxID=1969 RepID=UPI00368CB8B3
MSDADAGNSGSGDDVEALTIEGRVQGKGDNVAVLEAVVCVESANTALKLESVGDGVVDLATRGVPAVDDVQGVWGQVVVGRIGFGFERVSHFTQLAGVA